MGSKSQNRKGVSALRTSIFPNPETADENGIVCVGGELNAPLLMAAYQEGIFPWPDSSYPEMLWFSPDPRGTLPLEEIKTPGSFKKWAKKSTYQVKLNHNFKEILMGCAKANRPNQTDTWITKDIVRAYAELFDLGLAYSVGVYEQNNLVGGMYGVCMDRFVSAESMFYVKTNASKLALWQLCQFLQTQDTKWIDIQMVTPVSEAFGGVYVKRKEFLKELKLVFRGAKSPKWWKRDLSL